MSISNSCVLDCSSLFIYTNLQQRLFYIFSCLGTKLFPTQILDDNIFVHLSDGQHHYHLFRLHNHRPGKSRWDKYWDK